MKKVVIIFVLGCFAMKMKSQSFLRHEIGLGLGYLTTGEGSTDARKYPNSYFVSKTQSIFLPDYYNRNQVKLAITPVIYYTFHITKNLNFRSNFQYAQLNSTIPTYHSIYLEPEYLDFSYQDRFINWDLGLAYIFRKTKKNQLYLGIDYLFQNRVNSMSGSGYLNKDINQFYNQNRINVQRKHGVQALFGVHKSIYKNISVNYEASIGFFTNFYFRPINRISLNYQF